MVNAQARPKTRIWNGHRAAGTLCIATNITTHQGAAQRPVGRFRPDFGLLAGVADAVGCLPAAHVRVWLCTCVARRSSLLTVYAEIMTFFWMAVSMGAPEGGGFAQGGVEKLGVGTYMEHIRLRLHVHTQNSASRSYGSLQICGGVLQFRR